MKAHARVLRHRDFRLLFLGQSASAVGDQVVIVALARANRAVVRAPPQPSSSRAR